MLRAVLVDLVGAGDVLMKDTAGLVWMAGLKLQNLVYIMDSMFLQYLSSHLSKAGMVSEVVKNF